MKTGILVTKRQLTYEIHWHAVFLKQEGLEKALTLMFTVFTVGLYHCILPKKLILRVIYTFKFQEQLTTNCLEQTFLRHVTN